jgi:hypothetical protein
MKTADIVPGHRGIFDFVEDAVEFAMQGWMLLSGDRTQDAARSTQ